MTYLSPLRYLFLTRFIVFGFLHILVILCFILCFIFRFSYHSFIFFAVLNLFFFSVVSLAIIFLNSFDIFCFEFTFSFKSDMVFFACLFFVFLFLSFYLIRISVIYLFVLLNHFFFCLLFLRYLFQTCNSW